MGAVGRGLLKILQLSFSLVVLVVTLCALCVLALPMWLAEMCDGAGGKAYESHKSSMGCTRCAKANKDAQVP